MNPGGPSSRKKAAAVLQGAVLPAAALRAMQGEREFQRAVCEMLDLYKWLWWHDVDSRRNKRGLPDLIAIRRDRLIFAELKSATGRLSEDQADWLYRLGQLGTVETYVWRPSDSDEVERVLA